MGCTKYVTHNKEAHRFSQRDFFPPAGNQALSLWQHQQLHYNENVFRLRGVCAHLEVSDTTTKCYTLNGTPGFGAQGSVNEVCTPRIGESLSARMHCLDDPEAPFFGQIPAEDCNGSCMLKHVYASPAMECVVRHQVRENYTRLIAALQAFIGNEVENLRRCAGAPK